MKLDDLTLRLSLGFNFTLDAKGQVVKDTVADRIRKICSRSYRTERAAPIAKALKQILKTEERLEPSTAKDHESLRVARIFRKKILLMVFQLATAI